MVENSVLFFSLPNHLQDVQAVEAGDEQKVVLHEEVAVICVQNV